MRIAPALSASGEEETHPAELSAPLRTTASCWFAKRACWFAKRACREPFISSPLFELNQPGTAFDLQQFASRELKKRWQFLLRSAGLPRAPDLSLAA